jgi:acyl-CoA thioesterase I
MAAVSRGASAKSISCKMFNVPVESVTDLKTCATETIEELADTTGVSLATDTAGSNMSALSKISELVDSDFSKLGRRLNNALVKPLAALLLGSLLASPGLAQAPANAASANTILIVGDSLSAEYGLKRGTGWVPLLEKQISAEKKNAKVVNASISGDTTSGGRSRLPALLAQHKPGTVVIELGGNDALRGLPLDMTEKNLTAMTQAAKKGGAKVLLLGMQVPPNYGGNYGATFSGLFTKVAKAEKVALVPFFLKGVADVEDVASQFQPDRIHPNEQAQSKMLANVWPELKKLIP